MSRADFEERENYKRFVGALSKPDLDEKEEFKKFLDDLTSCAAMNRKGLEPYPCDLPHLKKVPEPEDIVILADPSIIELMMYPKATGLKAKPVFIAGAGMDPYGVRWKLTPPEAEPVRLGRIGYGEHPRARRYRVLNNKVLRAEAEKASRYYLPREINSLLDSINKSRSLLELGDNWDGEGSVGYTEQTWIRARDFLMRNAIRLYQSQKKFFDPPEIMAGPNGSMDLHWKTDARELLINVPARSEETISYYGDDRAEDTENAIRGKNIESSPNTEWIFLWLTQ
jgi:hypothetical protein